MKFRPEDFTSAGYDYNLVSINPYVAAEEANKKLKKWIDKAQNVKGILDPQDGVMKWIDDPGIVLKKHKAKLVCIEEIK